MLTRLEQARVAVVVLNWNGRDVLPACLEALRAQTWRDFAVLVVDNHSDDNSGALVTTAFADMTLLALPENLGFAAGNNRGIEHLWRLQPSLEYIALLNNDTRPQPTWLEHLVHALERRPDAGMAASKILQWDGTAAPTTIDTAGDVFYRHGLAGKRGNGEAAANYAEPDEPFGACPAAALYRGAMLRETGLFDEAFFAYNEDVDLNFRAQLAGWRCVYEPRAVVWHRVSHSARQWLDRTLYWSKRNTVWVVIKNMPAGLLLRLLPRMLIYHLGSDCAWMACGRIGPVVRGRWAALRGLRDMLRKRAVVQRARRITSRELLERMTRPARGHLRSRALWRWLRRRDDETSSCARVARRG